MSRRNSHQASGAIVAAAGPDGSNDVTVRETIWRRIPGDEWAAYEALPPAVRRRLQEHAYDAWAVNALILWRMFRRQTASSRRAERRLLRYLDACEMMERAAFAAVQQNRFGMPVPHIAARATVLRYAVARPTAADEVADAPAC